MRVRDRRFIKALYREYGLPVPAARHVNLIRYGDLAGYCIEVVDGRRVLARIAWCPKIEHRAHVLSGLPKRGVDVAVLNTLVEACLARHRYGMTPEECIEMTHRVIRLLGDAIAQREWTIARELWSWMSPLHAMLIEHEPMCAHVGTALAQNEAMAGPWAPEVH